MQDKANDLNQAAADNQHQMIEEIAHSLKGFTGQTCIYEISNKSKFDPGRNAQQKAGSPSRCHTS